MNGLTTSEMDFVRNAKQKGYTILRNGWPDFMLIRGDLVVAVEVKHGSDKLSFAQREMRRLFAQMGIPYYIAREGKLPPELGGLVEESLPTLGLSNKHLMVLRGARVFCEANKTLEFCISDLIDGLVLSKIAIFKICDFLIWKRYLTKRKGEGRGSPNVYRFVTTPEARNALSRIFLMLGV